MKNIEFYSIIDEDLGIVNDMKTLGSGIRAVSFRVQPMNAKFDAELNMKKHWLTGSVTFEVRQTPERTSLYGDSANCVDSRFMKQFCCCKDFVKIGVVE